MRPELKVIRGGLALRPEPVNVGPSDPMAYRVRYDRGDDLCQRLEDAAVAADKCGMPVLLAPDVVHQIAFYLRLGGAA